MVILHEEAEDGNAMPDLEKPVMAVSKAVVNLVKVTFWWLESTPSNVSNFAFRWTMTQKLRWRNMTKPKFFFSFWKR